MSGKKIMLVEDSPAIIEVIEENLSKAGYEVYPVYNGFEALRDLEDIQPDLIITDLNMPKLDGLKLCWGIQNRDETREIPFIILSSNIDDETVQKGKELGARYFISKPFEIKTVLDCVRKSLE
ncbi:MAG: response regulator [bacterium]